MLRRTCPVPADYYRDSPYALISCYTACEEMAGATYSCQPKVPSTCHTYTSMTTTTTTINFRSGLLTE